MQLKNLYGIIYVADKNAIKICSARKTVDAVKRCLLGGWNTCRGRLAEQVGSGIRA